MTIERGIAHITNATSSVSLDETLACDQGHGSVALRAGGY